MKCPNCDKEMKFENDLNFNQFKISGWKCRCGEIYFNPEQAQRILLMNKLKSQIIKAKLGRIRSNLIIRLPKNVEEVLNLKQGKEVSIKIEDRNLVIMP